MNLFVPLGAPSNARSASLEAIVIRADGSRQDLGVIAYWHRNPLRRLAFRLRRALNGALA